MVLMTDTTRHDKSMTATSSIMEQVVFLSKGDNDPVLPLDKVQAAPAELEDNRPKVKDLLEEINVRTADEPHPLFISAMLPQPMKTELCKLLEEFKDCFAWNYHEHTNRGCMIAMTVNLKA